MVNDRVAYGNGGSWPTVRPASSPRSVFSQRDVQRRIVSTKLCS